MIKYWRIKMSNILSLPLLLKQLKLMTMLKSWEDTEQQAQHNNWRHGQYLQSLAELEVNSRYSSRIKRYVKESKLPAGKTITTFKFGDIPSINRKQIEAFAENTKWVKECHNLILFGPSGLGKTHLASAIAYGIVTQGIRVLFTKTTSLVQKLQEAKKQYQLPEAIAKLNRYQLLILDDVGYAKKDELETSVLFELIADRYETGSIIITSNLAFSEWDQIFPDSMMAVAAIDRIIHHSTVISVTGTSYRKKESEKQKNILKGG
jgi:DNA replication protein DnaC